MPQHLGLTALIVRDYDEALGFYIGKLGFELREDTRLDSEKRWVVVAPPGRVSATRLPHASYASRVVRNTSLVSSQRLSVSKSRVCGAYA